MPTLPVVANRSSRSDPVVGAIATAAAATGIDFAYLYNQARVESSLDPDAQAKTSSATGLFQFTRQTWLATLKTHGAAHGYATAADSITHANGGQYQVANPDLRSAILALRNDPAAASAMAAEFASDNHDYLAHRIGRPIEPVDLYLAHFLGAQGAARFLEAHQTDPAAPAALLLPAAAQANRAVFFTANGSPRSLGDIRDNFAAKLNAAPVQSDRATTLIASRETSSTSSEAPANSAPLLRTIVPMPARLSLAFAHQAYQQLSGGQL